MAKTKKFFIKTKTAQILIAVIIILLAVLAGIFLFRFLLSKSINHYLIENKYYGFKLQTPKNWIAKEKTIYSESNIAQILAECKNDKSDSNPVYQVGDFRFQNQKYPDGFGDPGYLPTGLSSGAVLGISINCVAGSLNQENQKYSGNLKVAGEQAIQKVLDLSGFGKTESISFLHNGFQYTINEDIYISPNDKNNENNLRENYAEMLNKIISSFAFIK